MGYFYKRQIAVIAIASLLAAEASFGLGTAVDATRAPSTSGPKANTAAFNQEQAQKDNQKQAKEGQGMAQLMGIASIALGGYMIKTGIQTNASCTCGAGTPMIISGAMAVLQGIQGLMGAAKLGEMAGKSAGFGANLGSLSPTTTKFNTGGGPSGFSFDPDALKKGKIGDILGKFEKSTGISRDALAKALASGASAQDILSKAGISKADINKALGGAQAAIAKDPNALAANGKKLGLDKLGKGINLGLGSSDAVASANKASVGGDLLKDLNLNSEEAAPSIAKELPPAEISAELQSELDKAGMTDKTIFQMVRNQYGKKTPMLFGSEDRDPAALSDFDLPKGI